MNVKRPQTTSFTYALPRFLSGSARQLQRRGRRGAEGAEKTDCRFEISNSESPISSLCSLRVLCALCVNNLNARFLSTVVQTLLVLVTLALINAPPAPAQKKGATPKAAAQTVTLKTHPNAAVWLDDVRRGTTDAQGSLEMKVSPGVHRLRVRAGGYAEQSFPLLPAQRGLVSITLRPTKDEAELAFQQAEEQREKGGGEEGRARAVELYRKALKLRPRFPAAHVGLARVLLSQEQHDAALAEIAAARRDRPGYAEASAVEGRVLRGIPDEEGAIASFQRSIREARGFQPEAHAGLGLVLEERGDHESAVNSFRRAIAQLSDTEPVLYEFLGRNLEKLERWKDAVAAYEKYLELAPTGSHASAINSIIDQLRQ
ncbi:MAG TPA: tetratricopeptide repeat protein, partial [Pyrinomonadaceae bacterium]